MRWENVYSAGVKFLRSVVLTNRKASTLDGIQTRVFELKQAVV